MSRHFALASFTALIATAALFCGAAQAQQVAFVAPPAQDQIAPPAAASTGDALNDRTIGNENAQLPSRLQRQFVDFASNEAPGTIIVDTPHTFLYFVLGNGKAVRYGIGVGREGFTWSGTQTIVRKAEWPDWTPPREMIARQPYLPRHMAGGPGNPLGARAMYLGASEYRIHGTNDPTTIGKFVSSGCIRLTNEDVIDLFNRVSVGTKVVVMPKNAVHLVSRPISGRDVAAMTAQPRPEVTTLSSGRQALNFSTSAEY